MTATILKSASTKSSVSTTSISLDLGAGEIPVDAVVVAGMMKAATGSVGCTMSDTDGNTYNRRCISNRASTVETSLFSALITNALEANDDIDVDLLASNNRKAIAVLAVTGIGETPNIASTNTPPASVSTNSGINHTTSINTSVTTTVDNCLIVVAVGCSGASNTCTPNSGQNWISGPEEHITGSSARNLFVFYKIVSTAGSYSFTATLGSNAGSTAIAAFPILEDVEPSSVEIGMIIDGELIPFTEVGQIIDGELIPFVEVGFIE